MNEKVFPFLLKFWPIILAVFLILVAGVETRYQVAQLVADRKVDIEQWRQLRAQGNIITNHESRLLDVETHITPQSIQKWGSIQRTVEEDHRDLKDHLRNHPVQ